MKANLSNFVLRPRSRYYLASQGRDAGIGYAEEGRWMWQSDVKLTKTIEKAIAIAEGASTLPEITSLPSCRRQPHEEPAPPLNCLARLIAIGARLRHWTK